VRIAALIILSVLLAGCAGADTVMQNPRSGAVATCGASWSDLDPWSQSDTCVANYEAMGWVRSNAPPP
jgi:hypothetical protein